ncbi:hypothetical protein QVD17_25464 [Tagetes erecta]|uniref:Sulfotransferase n=1 Tax=Tagetes erecta TaxID=13708 RepID=A0AAD8KGQ1_TARER|nr:hypothetical protein QVD17_25464 [Tagetes erecta]
MEEILKTFPQHVCSWLKGAIVYKYQDVWLNEVFLKGTILAQQRFKAHPNDVFLCSFPKGGTTWLKALAFAIITRETFDISTNPLLTNSPHDCIPFLEKELAKVEENQKNSCSLPIATHMHYHCLPDSVITSPDSVVTSNCKIVYIYRNMKDVIVSYYHFVRKLNKIPMENASFEEALDEFCQGISSCGSYWDHILGYWKASLSRPERFLFLKYEDMKNDPTSNVKRLAEFIGRPFTIEEEKANVIEKIIRLCSFENLSNLDVNKSGKHHPEECIAIENRLFFRKAKDGDWKNYFTLEMIEKVDKLIDEKFGGTGLVLK